MLPEKWGKGICLTCFLGILCLLIYCLPFAWAIEIDPAIEELYATSETAGYVIYFRAKANLSGTPKTDWKEQSEYINRALQENANRSQARVRSYLFDRRVPYRSVWKDNTIVVDMSSKDIFEGLKSFPEIESIKSKEFGPNDSRKIGSGQIKDSVPAGIKP